MKITPVILFLISAFVLVGCNTIEGAAKGAKHGMKKDWEAAQEADGWMKENMW